MALAEIFSTVATNPNDQLKKTINRAVTETFGLVFGKDVLTEF